MTVIADPEFWLRLFSIGVLNLLLSGDNALVIALAVRALPARKRIVGQLWGAIGAVVLRLVFVAIVSVLLRVPLLQLLGGLLLVMFGVGLSLPIVVWGAGLLAHLMNRYAWIVWLGGGLLGYVAGEMFMEDPIVRRGLGEVAGPLHYPVPLVVGLVVTACGW